MHGIESASSLQVLGGFGVGCWLLSLRVLRLRRGCWAASPYWDASLKVLRMPDEPAVTALFAGRDSFEDEAFADLDLSRGDLANREFLRCTFTNVRLPDADVRGARFDDCLFNGCDLSEPAPPISRRAAWWPVRCRLTGVDLSELRPTPSLAFEHCTLQYATFGAANLAGTRFASCKLVEVNVFETRLADADFTDSDLTGSRFEGCDLRGAQFAAARGFYADPSKNLVTGAQVKRRNRPHDRDCVRLQGRRLIETGDRTGDRGPAEAGHYGNASTLRAKPPATVGERPAPWATASSTLQRQWTSTLQGVVGEHRQRGQRSTATP